MTAAVTAPPVLDYEARLDEDPIGPWAGSWSITFGLGGPAQRSYTEVAFRGQLQELPASVQDEVVRRVAADLYGTAWASLYPPEQHAAKVARYGMNRRERVVVTRVEVRA